jgi:hypothetical protein
VLFLILQAHGLVTGAPVPPPVAAPPPLTVLPPEVTARLVLDVEDYDPAAPAGTLALAVKNRSSQAIRVPAAYDGRELLLTGDYQRGPLRAWSPEEVTQRYVLVSPGVEQIIVRFNLHELFAGARQRAGAKDAAVGSQERRIQWDWRLRLPPPESPIHLWRTPGYRPAAALRMTLRIADQDYQTEPIVVRVKLPPAAHTP